MPGALYTREILRLATSLKGARLAAPDKSVLKTSRICGSTVTIDIKISHGRVSAFGAEVKACALGQASTAIVERRVKGQSGADITAAKRALIRLLAGEQVAFAEPWQDLKVFEAAQAYKARHSAIVLPFIALEEALT
jgi:NifU-like protein involved in Fe-S cluster formation